VVSFRYLLLGDHLRGVHHAGPVVRGQRDRAERALVQQRRDPEVRRPGRRPLAASAVAVGVVEVAAAEVPLFAGPVLGQAARRLFRDGRFPMAAVTRRVPFGQHDAHAPRTQYCENFDGNAAEKQKQKTNVFPSLPSVGNVIDRDQR